MELRSTPLLLLYGQNRYSLDAVGPWKLKRELRNAVNYEDEEDSEHTLMSCDSSGAQARPLKR